MELPDGIRRQLPIGWTDRLPVRRCPVIGSSLVLFDAGRLLDLIRFLDALAEKWPILRRRRRVGIPTRLAAAPSPASRAHPREAPLSLSPKQLEAVAQWMAQMIRRQLTGREGDHEPSPQGPR